MDRDPGKAPTGQAACNAQAPAPSLWSADPELPDQTQQRDATLARPDLLSALERMQQTLSELRAALETVRREQRHGEFSAAVVVASVLEVLVAGLTAWAVTDWVFEEPAGGVLVKLGFALLLQVAALTAFMLGRIKG